VQRKIKAAQSSRPLTKRDAEELIDSFDANPQAALMRALRIATGMPHASWKSLVALTSTDLQHRELLYEGDQSCLDQLVKQLNEQRTI
jgi:hypothetical protein